MIFLNLKNSASQNLWFFYAKICMGHTALAVWSSTNFALRFSGAEINDKLPPSSNRDRSSHNNIKNIIVEASRLLTLHWKCS
uniref:Uncharacterized protein n=1 Tax=Rhizoctonia solani TaxID=456999 RepID=N0A598_9AGAM|nr:hypothetical protein RSOL_m01070 [Rhizoctonia solani]AGK45422.1 hypothetical protein RSOL_m01070 [Rhizoctonia solani]